MEQDLAKEVIERDRLSLKQKIEISLLIASLMCAISFGINHQILACIFSSAATLYVFRQLINTAFFLGMSKGSINDYRQAIDLYKSLH